VDVLSLPLTHPALVFIVLFLAILVAPIAAERVGVPGIIGLIVAGIVVGPHTFGLLERAGAIATLGEAGLLYLMFLVGLDLDQESFLEHRRGSAVFTATTFAIPMVLVTGAGVGLGLSLIGALIVASAFTSHTPVTYPLVQRFGLARNRAVVSTFGATLIATVLALLVFSVIAGVGAGDVGPEFWIPFALALGVSLWLVLRGLPRLTRWFFSGMGQDRLSRFLFVLVVLFGFAAFAEITGIQAIVGAFLAGLALNRSIPDGSRLRERVDFLGEALLVPVFLVSTGMLVDPVALVVNPDRLGLGVGLTVAALGAKALAAGAAARILGYDRAERGVMVSLTTGQAAGALAVALVAVELDLLQERALDAVIVVVLLTCLFASFWGSRFAPRVERPSRPEPPLGRTVVVPVANPDTVGPLTSLAGRIAVPDGGEVLTVKVIGFEADADALDRHRQEIEQSEEQALGQGAEARSLVRIDSSPSEGVLHTIVENDASCLLLGWKGYANAREDFFGGIIDAVLARTRVPALICRPAANGIGRVVLCVTEEDLTPAGAPDLRLSMNVAVRLAADVDVPFRIVTVAEDPDLMDLVPVESEAEIVVDQRRPAEVLPERTAPGDLVILGIPPVRTGIGHDVERLAGVLPERWVLLTVPR
jgi:Kef-type K+ transport system membrane component KefB